jgi:HNH endonuclease
VLLVKLVQHQESGFSAGVPNQRGAYLLISKDWYKWFPPLSDTRENDSALIRLEFVETGPVVVPYVWHNSKAVHGKANGRDESRVYVAGLARLGLEASPGDLVVFVVPHSSPVKPYDRFRACLYRNGSRAHSTLMALRPNAANYWCVSSPLVSLGLVGSPVLTPNALTPASVDCSAETVEDDSDVLSAVGSDVAKRLQNTPDEVLAQRISDTNFRAIVLSAYENRCAITGSSILVGKHLNLEAAHIHPVSHGGGNLPSNGIALSRDLHWAFDKGAFTFDPALRTVDVHRDARLGLLASIHGKTIRMPTEEFYAPRREFVDYHRKHVFGLFKSTGTLARPDLA